MSNWTRYDAEPEIVSAWELLPGDVVFAEGYEVEVVDAKFDQTLRQLMVTLKSFNGKEFIVYVDRDKLILRVMDGWTYE